MEKIRFSEIKIDGEGLALITKISADKQSKNGKPYIVMTLSDGEDTRDLTVFCARKDFTFSEKQIVNVAVRVNGEYLNIEKLEPADGNIYDFVISAPEDPEKLFTKVIKTLEAMRKGENSLYDVSIGMLNQYKDRILYYPASEEYNGKYVGGMIYYIFTCLQDIFNLSRGSHSFNTETVANAVVLSSISSLFTMDATDLGEAEKNIFAYINNPCELSVKMVNNYIRDNGLTIPKDKKMALEVAIKASHGKKAYGSSCDPVTKEAYVTSIILSLNAKLDIYEKALKNLKRGEMAEVKELCHPVVNI